MNHVNAILANFLWGMVPAYYFVVRSVDPLRMTAYRFVFTFLLLLLIGILLRKSYTLRFLRQSLIPAGLLTINAYVYLVAVMGGHVLEAAYGYLMAPILTIVLGRLILLEPLSVNQWTGTIVCLAAIVFYAAMAYTLPWFGFGIALPFALYLIWHRQKGSLSSIEALKHESLVMLIVPFSLFAFFGSELEALVLFELGGELGIVIVASGLVTVVPLALYVNSCIGLSIIYLGAYQFIAPIVSALVAIFLFEETMTMAKAITGTGLLIGLAFVTLPIGSYFEGKTRSTN